MGHGQERKGGQRMNEEVLVKGVWKPLCEVIRTQPMFSSVVPDKSSVRGTCPECRAPLYSELVYRKDAGYLLLWQCANGDCLYVRCL